MLHIVDRAGGHVVAELPEDVDLFTTPGLRAVADRIIDEGCRHLTLDACRTLYMDSTGITALIMWYHRLERLGGTLSLAEVDEHLFHLLDRLGLNTVMSVTPRAAPPDP